MAESLHIPGVAAALARLPAPVPIWRGRVDADEWLDAARAMAESGGRLVALWGLDPDGDPIVGAAYARADGLVWLEHTLSDALLGYPDLTPHFPCAARMQRATADLLGINAIDAVDTRPWLDHGQWRGLGRPLRAWEPPAARSPQYPFVRVEGDGVHEIAVGPVHAGIIEPGHFRFSVVGEKVLRLEQRLGYTHKGIEKRFTELGALEAHRLAGRVSGDSTVAFAWAYCMALEAAASCTIPPRARWLRALLLERERIANHLGDLGALGNDGGLAFGLAQFSRLREDWQRLSGAIFGHRLLMDCVRPGGVTVDPDQRALDRLRTQCDVIERELHALRVVYDEHSGLQDRFITTGRVTPQLAARLGLTGLAGRASGQSADLRCDQDWEPYNQLDVRMATHRNGDVAARVTLRFEETLESLRLIREICARLPEGGIHVDVVLSQGDAVGAGWVEGWRGEVLVALQLTAGGKIRRCHCHDPSWQNWPVLEHAVIGNIVPDFPLINKSFNLSYSGHDL